MEEKQCTEDREDRISALPDSLILHIFSYLPMKAVVKTGVLSKRWDHLWTQVSDLTYRGQWPHAKYSEKQFQGFVNFVNHTLSLHETKAIGEFSLFFSLCEKPTSKKVKKMSSALASHVDRWIRFAVRKKANLVCIHFNPDLKTVIPSNAPYKLPGHLCSNGSIETLYLAYCVFNPVNQICWNSLIDLTLCYMELTDEVIQNIFRGSPKLEKLCLWDCIGMKNLSITSQHFHTLQWCLYSSKLSITAPYVKTLTLDGDMAGLDLINVSSLVTADLNLVHAMLDEPQPIVLSRLLTVLGHAEALKVSTEWLQVLSMLEIQSCHLSPLNCKILQILTRRTKWDLAGIVALLKASTNLQKLIIHTDKYAPIDIDDEFLEKHDFDEANYWSSLSQFPSLSTIKTVIIYDFRGESSETALVEFMYKNAQVLQTMEIISKKDGAASEDRPLAYDNTLKFSQKLLSLRRASPDAIVLFS